MKKLHLKKIWFISKKWLNPLLLLYALRFIYKFVAQKLYDIIPKSFMARSLIIIIAPIVILQIILMVYFYDKHWEDITKRLSDYLAGDISFLITAKQSNLPQNWEVIKNDVERHMSLIITFRKDEILTSLPSDRGHSQLERIFQSRLARRIPYEFTIDAWSYPQRAEIKIQLDDGVMRIMALRKRLFSKTTYIFVIWMIGSSIILTGISIYFMRSQIRPIRRLAIAAEHFGKGKSVFLHHPSGPQEVRKATAAFHRMQERIVRQINQRTEMLAGVSHDLRTPLTRMSLLVAMVEKEHGRSEETQDLKINIREMEKMIEGYLAFAKGANAEMAEVTDITQLLHNVAKKCAKKKVQIAVHVEDKLQRALKPVAFQRCLLNLVSNATRYGKRVILKAWHEQGKIIITIDDNGPGIPKSQRKAVFKPFYRLDSARRADTGGIGLGLAIAKDIMRSHGGEIELLDSHLGGLCVHLTLPV